MPVIPPGLLDVVVAVGVRRNDGSDQWVGTGFLYDHVLGAESDGQSYVRGYLVTNRHVASSSDVLTIKMNPRGMPPASIQIAAIDSSGEPLWAYHPNPDVDVAVTGVLHGALNGLGLAGQLAPLFSTQTFPLSRLEEAGVVEGDAVAVVGFPMELVTLPRARPIVRSGCIARISDLYDQGGTEMLIDVQVFPGNSGGPVFLLPQAISVTEQPPLRQGGLLGIVHSYVPYMEVAVSPQTGRPRIMFEENSGLTLLHTVDCINETIAVLEKRHPLPPEGVS